VFYGNLVDIIIMTKEDADANTMVATNIVVNIVVLGIGIIIIAIAAIIGAAQDLGAVGLVMTVDGSTIGTIELSPIMALIAGRRIHLKYLSLKV
jgi:hypothetical protein